MGGEGVSHGALSGIEGSKLSATGGRDRKTASVIVVAKAAEEGLDSRRGDWAQQSSAASCVICVRGAPAS